MDERILLRSSVLENRNIPSEAIRLPAGERDPETLLRQLFREPPELSLADLTADYQAAEAGREGRGLFLPAFRVDEEYALSLDQHILLHKLVRKEPPYEDLVPWYYRYGQRYLGDAWWFSPEEILSHSHRRATGAFHKKNKGFSNDRRPVGRRSWLTAL